MVEVCGGEEREKLVDQSCESTQGIPYWSGLLAAAEKPGLPMEYSIHLNYSWLVWQCWHS